MQIIHYDLFAGIGGFSLALDTVFYEHKIQHIFCEWEEFPTQVLKKHWPEGIYYGDIADLVADTKRQRRKGGGRKDKGRLGQLNRETTDKTQTILTGGFPCQPFSQAGRRKGTSDDRYKWPEMFEVIRNIKPTWVIAENVRGLVTWNEGMVLETVCADLEGEGYEVQPLIVPACAKGAPHRRDRVWIIGHTKHDGQHGTKDRKSSDKRGDGYEKREKKVCESERTDSVWNDAQNPISERGGGRGGESGDKRWDTTSNPHGTRLEETWSSQQAERHWRNSEWERDWKEVALATCHDGMDDGLPRRVGGLSYSRAKWRREALKAYGNAIVPQVAMEIFRGIIKPEEV